MRLFGTRFMALVAGVALSAACSKETDSLVLVSVTASPPDTTLTTLSITVETTTRTYALMGGLGATAKTFGIYVGESVTGSVAVTARATGASACNGYTGSGIATIVAGGTTPVPTSIALVPGNTCPAGTGGAPGAGGGGGITGTGGAPGAGGGGGITGTGGGLGVGGSPGLGGAPPVTQLTCVEYNHNATTGACTTATDPTTGINDTVISDIAFSKDSKYLFTAGSDGRVKIWNWNGTSLTPEGTVLSSTGFTYMALSPNGKLLALGSGAGDLTIWNIGPGWTAAATLTGVFDDVYGLAFSPDSTTLYVIESSGFLDIFTSASMDLADTFLLNGTPFVIAASPTVSDGSFWLGIGYAEGTASQSNVVGGVLGGEQGFDVSSSGASTWTVQYAPDGKSMAVGAQGGVIGLWPVPPTDGTPLSTTLRISTNFVNYVAFSPNGSELAIAAGGSTASRLLGIWNTTTGIQRVVYPGITYRPFSVNFSAEGALAVGGHDCGSVLICPSK